MAKKLVKNTDGFNLSFDEVVELYKQNKLQLGINETMAVMIANEGIVKGSVFAAFSLYNWLAIAVGVYGIYLSFTLHWWYFILGAFITNLIWRANKKGNAQNIVNAAMSNSKLYKRVSEINGWIYMIEEDTLNSMSNNSVSKSIQ